MDRLSCAIVTLYPMPDVRAFSGISYHMARQFEQLGIKVHYVTAEMPPPSLYYRVRQKFYKKVFGWGMRTDREPSVIIPANRELDDKLKRLDVDFIFAPGSLAVPYLTHPKPKFFWSDATFAGYIDFNEEFTDMSPETIRKGNRLEQRSIDNCDAVFYSSDWAAQTAIDHYRVDPGKIQVVPFGANFEVIPDGQAIRQIIAEKNATVAVYFL